MNLEKININQTFNQFKNIRPYDTEKTSLIVFACVSIVFPIVLNFVFYILSEFVFKGNTNLLQSFRLWYVLANLLFQAISFFVFAIRDFRWFVSNRIYCYFIYTLFSPLILSFISSFVASTIIDFLLKIAIVFFTFFRHDYVLGFFKRLKNWKNIIITILLTAIGIGMFYLLSFIMTSLTKLFATNDVSNNQESLNKYLNTTYGIILLFFLSCIFAPIIEEFVFRMFLIDILNGKWFGYILSFILFAFLHIQNTFDWTHILMYLPLGIVNGLIYKLTKNIVPCISIHFICNLVAFISLIVTR
ncbi:CPBP family intramembrane glutamic endopeptidase [Malacoplasma iowae]|uniref:CAAX amino-terminal protease associated with self-immunity n=1 Tax=Malacoplasma iowae DK-CPA TaxID=1394179 RepID=A0A084U384_MALIO|nr:type II CAAX endopeptidase family protein [Malacoplasma iowae]KFB07420.1 CAAX amino-terminal protease associated with self-immunity [Malacoplasma iowae DK-CPA]WPL36939.1 type II CAAX endopeptidase family protein [Malacoplasma iowae]WPL38134.1 type II CAAX endopeptidase family protein [Malacoplasma iowae]WPL41413.1 type II CAAX endopeptidase family protein [Malacoplasma iowae]